MGRLLVILIAVAIVYYWSRPPKALASGRIPPALAILLALLYFGSPIDVLPDAMGPVGFLDDIVVLLATLWWTSQQPDRRHAGRGNEGRRERQRAGAAPTGEPQTDPYAILGIDPGASETEITHAYRAQMKRYHPDRVADLGDELREVAHRKTVEIQRAYEALK